MANSDKNIVITPNIGSTTSDPKIVFSGAGATNGPQNITLSVYPTNSGMLSFEGSAGQLFSITNNLSGTIFSVNDVSGIPSMEVLDTGLVKVAEYSGNVLLGTSTDNGTNKLQVAGNISSSGTITATTFSGSLTGNASTATTLATARNIGGVSFNGSANIDLPGVNITGTQNTSGSAATLTTGRTIALTGDVTYTSGAFNGSANVTGAATLASVGTAGTYTKVTTDAKGRVTSGTTLADTDIPNLNASKITAGTIDAARLPSYVDDVIEGANLAAFPATGETGKIYVALNTNKTYRWSGSAYIFITSGAVDSVAGKTGVVTLVKADVGLGSVDNTADSAKNVATAATLTTARTINGVSFNGSANITVADSTKLPLTGGTLSGKLNSQGGDSARLFESLNSSASNSVQFYIDHNLGATNIGNARGVLNLVSSGALTIGGSVALTAGNYNTYSPTLTGTGASGNWGINVTGSAATLTTARTIGLDGDVTGSVSFNGSANVSITAAVVDDSHAHSFNNLLNKTGGTGTYTTSGDFRAPIFYDSNNTAYHVDPTNTSNLTTLYADRYFQRASGIPTNNLGDPTVTEMALFDRQFNNKTAFYPAANLKFFTSTDGVTWTEYTSFTEAQKKAFLGGDASSGVFIPNATPYFRIELTNNGNYVYLNALYMYWSGSGNSTTVKIQKRRASDDAWLQHTNSSTTVSSWPGHLYLPFGTIPYISPSSTSSGHFDTINIDFQPTWATANAISLYNMEVWGGYPAGSRNIYSTDSDRNVAFPTILTAATDVRAPLFYDSDNTGYYIDPNSTSRLYVANVNFLTLLNDEGLNVKGIRGQFAAGSDSQGISLFSNVDIGYPSGWGSGLANTPSRGLSVYGGLRVSYGGDGFITSDTSVRSPIFYDSNDTAYFVDPNSSSVLVNIITRSGGVRLDRNYDNNALWFTGSLDANHTLWNDYNGGPGVRGGTGSGFDGMKWNAYRGIHIRGGSSGAYNLIVAQNSGGATNDHTVELYALNVKQFETESGYALATNQMRAPIFYDSANTAYYVDAASTSVLATMRATATEHVAGDGNGMRFWLNDDYKIYMSASSNATWGGRASGETTSDYNMYFRMSGGTNRGFVFRNGTTNVAGIDATGRIYSGDGRLYLNNANSNFIVASAGTSSALYMEARGGGFTVRDAGSGSSWFTALNGTCTATTDFRAPIFYDSDNTAYYTNPAGVSQMYTLNMGAGITADTGSVTRVTYPGGGAFSSNPVTGAIKITLPVSWTNTMMSLRIRIYDYANGESFEVNCGGYNYSGSSSWINTFAYIVGEASSNRNFNIRFGHDGTKCCIVIGEVGSVWDYPKVVVEDVLLGHSNFAIADWDDGWSISTITTLPTITSSKSNVQVGRFGNIFYDSDNTAFYVDPAGTTNINTLNGNGKQMFTTADSYLRMNEANGFTNGVWMSNSNFGGGAGTFHLGSNGDPATSRIRIIGGTYNGSTVITLNGADGSIHANKTASNNTPSIQVRGGNPGYPRIQTYGLDADAAAWMGLGTDMAGGPYEHSVYFPNGSGSGRLSIGDYNGTTYNPRLWVYTTYTQINNSARSPIFYDSDNTGYYTDPNSTSNLNGLTVAGTITGSVSGNAGGSSNRLASTRDTPSDSLQYWQASGLGTTEAPTGDWHNTIRMGHGSPLSYYSNTLAIRMTGTGVGDIYTQTIMGGTAQGWKKHWNNADATISASGDFRAPIFYDSNNTGYYVDPNSVSRMINVRADYYERPAHNQGHLRGGYNNIGASEAQTSPIYCIGSSYEPAATTLANMYGIGYTSGGSFFPSGASDWGLYLAHAGVSRIHLSGGSGNITTTGNITAYASDRRLKTNIIPISNALEKLMRISGVEFDWVDNIADIGFIPGAMHETGVIAQEIQAVIPDAVVVAPFNNHATELAGVDNEYLTVDKEKIIPLLIEAIKELKAEIETLKSTAQK